MISLLCFVLCHKQLKQTTFQEAHWDKIQMDHRADENHANKEKGEKPIKHQNSNKDTEKLGMTGISGFMVTMAPGEQEDPILKAGVGDLISLFVMYY